jgi:GNAT superfamily N-acetyltransferase
MGWQIRKLVAGELVGMVGFYQRSGPKDRHKGIIWGMYVKPCLQGNGLGSTLGESYFDELLMVRFLT